MQALKKILRSKPEIYEYLSASLTYQLHHHDIIHTCTCKKYFLESVILCHYLSDWSEQSGADPENSQGGVAGDI